MNAQSDPHHCRKFISEISEYVDGTLDPQLCADLEKHLCECENCTIVVDTLRKTIDLVQTCTDEDGLPGEVRTRLFHHLNLDDYLSKPKNL